MRVDGPADGVAATVDTLTRHLPVTRQSPPRPSRTHTGHVLVYLDLITPQKIPEKGAEPE